MTQDASTSRLAFSWPAVVLSVLVLAAFGRVAGHDFTGWDDPTTIANNPTFNPPQIAAIAHYWIAPADALYAPLTYTTWGLLAFIGRVDQPDETGAMLNPWVFHSANVLIHLAAALLAFACLRRLTTHEFAAWIGAAIFAVHPVQVEAVAWASGTKDLLCGLFIVAAMYSWIRHRAVDHNTNWYRLATTLMLLACLSKPTGIVAAPMALVVDRMLLRTPWRRSLRSLAPGLVISVVFAVIASRVQPPVMAALPSLWARPLIATDALAFYLYKLVWPSVLSIDYGRLPGLAIERGWIYYTWVAPAVLAAIAVRARRRLPLLAAGAMIALIGVAPVLGLLPFTFQAYSTVADHYLYPSMIGIAMIVTAVLQRFNAHSVRVAAMAIVMLFTVQSFAAAGHWRDSATLFAHTLNANGRSFLALTGRAMDEMRHGHDDDALVDLKHAIAINPDFAFSHLSLGGLMLKHGDARSALKQYREVLRIHESQRNYDPRLASDALLAIAARLLHDGYVPEAIDALEDATRRDPTNERAVEQLGAARLRQSPTTR